MHVKVISSLHMFFFLRYKTYINDSFILFFKKKSWDIELSNIARDFSDISIANAQLTEENKKLAIDIETVADLINER